MFLLAKVSYLFLTTCRVVVFSRAGQSRSVEDTNALVSAECSCHPLVLLCPTGDVACLSPHGEPVPWAGARHAADNNLLVPARGLGASAMAKDPGATWDTPPSLPPGELAVLQPGTILLAQVRLLWELLGIANCSSMAELSTAVPLQSS